MSPQDNKAVYQVQACTQEEVDACFAAAKAAGRDWAKTPLWKRAEYLHKVAASLKENAQVRDRHIHGGDLSSLLSARYQHGSHACSCICQ